MNEDNLDWKECYERFYQKIQAQLNHQGQLETDAETEKHLRDLAARYARNERTLELYQAMESVESFN